MLRHIVILFLIVICSSCNKGNQKEEATKPKGWEVIYINDDQGKPLFGDIENLKKAVRQGCVIRVGWGIHNEYKRDRLRRIFKVEHTAEAEFLTISEGHVFAQLDRIMGQAPSRERPKINLVKTHYWHSVLGTTGEMTQVYQDYNDVDKSDEFIDDVKMTWYVNVADCDYNHSDNKPLY
ncbi:hypothetical protein [Aquimarina litoralis]|uniref:hypothetical protein n=1 Tax=Aquimarina litoralis TaxID=584605 RepID=UPI001C55C57E|nr:hypothetical protein [Aquimarina litoralis]MBW1294357.1 hypothetical protein [Aquimarina litoralis]